MLTNFNTTIMKNAFFVFILLGFISSCGNESNDPSTEDSKKEIDQSQKGEEASDETDQVAEIVDEEPEKYSGDATMMLGTWTGEMNGKKLTIVIENVTETTIRGYNILGSNRRDLKGTYERGNWDQPCSMAYSTSLAEPGDDKWDGVFQIKFVGYEDTNESDEGIDCMGGLEGFEAFGEWKSNNGKLNHRFDLARK
jgi:hypothetical protein